MFTTDGSVASLPPPIKRTANTISASKAIATTAPPNTMVAGFFTSIVSMPSSYGGNTTTGISAVSDKFVVAAAPRASVRASVSTPSRMRRTSSRTSMAFSYRRCSFFAMHLATTDSNPRGKSATTSRNGCGKLCTCWYAIATAESPTNGARPATNSYIMTPSE